MTLFMFQDTADPKHKMILLNSTPVSVPPLCREKGQWIVEKQIKDLREVGDVLFGVNSLENVLKGIQDKGFYEFTLRVEIK